jgi:uncharacterized protein with NRDE domain
MCLLVIAWRSHPRYRVVLAANRDEFHSRPSAPISVWQDGPPILAGRDLEAGGAWLGVDRARRCAVVTNFRDLAPPVPGAPTRGGLVPGYLGGAAAPSGFLAAIGSSAPRYAGFNLLLADGEELWHASNRAEPFARRLAPGLYGLSNHLLDTPWPKLLRVRARAAALLQPGAAADAGPAALAAALFEMLADRERAELHDLPPTGLPPEREHMLSSPFVLDADYGTRCSTVLLLGHDDTLYIAERRFAAAGEPAGGNEWLLNAGEWAANA